MSDSYVNYLDEYREEAFNKKNRYLGIMEESTNIEESVNPEKKGVYKRNFFLKNNLQDTYVSKVLEKRSNREKIIEFTGKFIDDHSEQLSTSGPVYMFTFSNRESEALYNIFNINADILLDLWYKLIEETYYGTITKTYTGWFRNAPHRLLLISILIEAIQKGYDDIRECCEYLCCFAEYPVLYRKYWKTGVKEDVMNYTIERLGNKYKIKTKNLKNLQELLKYEGNSAVSNFEERLKDGADNVYADFLQRLINQINSTLKNISIEYYINSEKNSTQHQQTTIFDDGNIADQEGFHSNVANIIDSTKEKILNSGVDESKLRWAAEAMKVDKDNLKGLINQIYSTKNNKIDRFIEDIIISFFEKYPNDTNISGANFINFGLSLYKSIGISKNETYMNIRAILNYWMFDIINIRFMYQRESTIISYTRAIYNYFIFMINYYNN